MSIPTLILHSVPRILATRPLLVLTHVVLVVKNLLFNAGDAEDVGSILRSGLPGVGNGNPLQYSWLENSMDRGASWATVHGVAKSRTQLSD